MKRSDLRLFLGLSLVLLVIINGAHGVSGEVAGRISGLSLSDALGTLSAVAEGRPMGFTDHRMGVVFCEGKANGNVGGLGHVDEAMDMLLFTEPEDLMDGGTDDDIARLNDLLLSDEGIGEWFREKYDTVKGMRDLPGILASADAAVGSAEESLGVSDVIGAILYGLFDGLTMGLGEFYRDAIDEYKASPVCEAHSDVVKSRFDSARRIPVELLRGVFGNSSMRGGKGRVDFVGHTLKRALMEIGGMFSAIMTLVKTCAPLRQMLLPIVMLVVLGIVMTLVLFILPGFGVVLKIAGILLSAVFGAKYLVKVGSRLGGIAKRCVTGGGCVKEDKVGLIEGIAQLAGVTVSFIFLSGIKEALQTPNLAAHFSRAALMLKFRLTFTPRWSKDLKRLTDLLNAAKGGNANSAKAGLDVIAKDTALVDDAAKIADDTAKIADDTATVADDAARATDDTAKVAGKETGESIVDDIVNPTKNHAAEAAAAQAKVTRARSELSAAETELTRATQKANSWRAPPSEPAKEYKRMVHIGNGKFKEVSYGKVSSPRPTNPHSADVARAQRKVAEAKKVLASAEDEAAAVVSRHAEEGAAMVKNANNMKNSAEAAKLRDTSSKLADDTLTLEKATDDIALIKRKCCKGPALMLLQGGTIAAPKSVGLCIMDLGGAKMQLDRARAKLEAVKKNVENGVIDKEALAFDILDKALDYHPGVRLGKAVARADETGSISPLIKNALGLDKPKTKITAVDVYKFVKAGGVDGWRARRLAYDLDDAVKSVQRAERALEAAKKQYLRSAAAYPEEAAMYQ